MDDQPNLREFLNEVSSFTEEPAAAPVKSKGGSLSAIGDVVEIAGSGSHIRIDYLDESAPVVAVRLQEVFGLEKTPLIGGNRVPITFKLLSPAQRPVQVTTDLAGFWSRHYPSVRRELSRRYPRHAWPEDPLQG